MVNPKVIGLALGLAVAGAVSAHAFPIPPCNGPERTANDLINSTADKLFVEFVDVLLENEAEGGRVAYCLSDARMTNGLNGLSFGFIQHDLASNRASKKILATILQRTADGNLNSGLAKDDIAAVDRGVLSVRAPELRASKDLSLRDLIQCRYDYVDEQGRYGGD
jgi:hypothetical protein